MDYLFLEHHFFIQSVFHFKRQNQLLNLCCFQDAGAVHGGVPSRQQQWVHSDSSFRNVTSRWIYWSSHHCVLHTHNILQAQSETKHSGIQMISSVFGDALQQIWLTIGFIFSTTSLVMVTLPFKYDGVIVTLIRFKSCSTLSSRCEMSKLNHMQNEFHPWWPTDLSVRIHTNFYQIYSCYRQQTCSGPTRLKGTLHMTPVTALSRTLWLGTSGFQPWLPRPLSKSADKGRSHSSVPKKKS